MRCVDGIVSLIVKTLALIPHCLVYTLHYTIMYNYCSFNDLNLIPINYCPFQTPHIIIGIIIIIILSCCSKELPTKSVQSSKTPPDMKYIPRHVARQHTNFCDIRDAGGVEMTNDVYVRDPNHNTTSATSSSSSLFWFVGKVARVSDVTLEQCVARQYDLIAQHAVNLRPLELGLLSSSSSSASSSLQLELWTAPGDSELRVAYNEPDLVMVKMERDDDDDDANNGGEASKVNKNFVGFQGEIYDQGEEGFRTWRTGDGRAAKPQIIPATTSSTTSSSTAAGGGAAAGGTDETVASQEEMDRLLKVMDGLDVNELYKQQEKREGRQVED